MESLASKICDEDFLSSHPNLFYWHNFFIIFVFVLDNLNMQDFKFQLITLTVSLNLTK